MSLHYLVKHEWPKTQRNSPCSKKSKPMHFFVLAFQAVDLASTEHCSNIFIIYFYWAPKTALTCVQVLKFRLKTSLNGRRSAAFEADDDNQIFLHFVNSIVYSIILAIWRSCYCKQFFITEENEIYVFMHRLNYFWNTVNFVGDAQVTLTSWRYRYVCLHRMPAASTRRIVAVSFFRWVLWLNDRLYILHQSVWRSE